MLAALVAVFGSCMCYYITLIAPSADQAAIRAVMQKHRRAAMPFDNSSVAKVLRTGERQYLTTHGFCDCGTALIQDELPTPAQLEEEMTREAETMRCRGLSDAKIKQIIDERRSAHDRGLHGEKRYDPDSLEQWARIIDDLQHELSLPYVGLLVHFYDGRVDDEEFSVTRRTASPRCPHVEQLESLRPDELTIFTKA